MEKRIKILHLEDDQKDAELISAFLESKGVESDIALAMSEDEYRKAIDRDVYDIILSDYRLPSFDGSAALKIAQEKCPDTPVIFVSGTLGEEPAIEALLNGATDYVTKQKLSRLFPAVQRAMALVKERQERKRAEEELKKNEEKYRSIFENVQDVYYETLLDGTILEASPSVKLISKGQYNRTDLIGKSMYEFYPNTNDRDTLIAAIQKAGSVSDFEVQLKNRDGSFIPCSISAMIKFDAEGRPEKIIGSMHDITERKRAEEALQTSEKNFQRIMNAIHDIVYSVDGKTQEFTYLSPAFERLLGYTIEDIHQMGGRKAFMSQVIQERKFTEQDITFQQLQMGKGNVPTWESWWRRKDGTLVCLEDRSVPIYDGDRLVSTQGILSEITERKRAEEALRETTNYLENLLSFANAPIMVWDNNLRITKFNLAFERMTGYTMYDVLGKHPEILFLREMREDLSALISRTSEGENLMSIEMPVRSKDGSDRIVLWNTANIYATDEKTIIATIAHGQDITERKRAQEALLNERLLLRTLIDNIPDSIYSKDLSCRKTLANLAEVHNMGAKSEAEVLGKDDFESYSKEMAQGFYADDQLVIQTGQPVLNREEYVFDEKGKKQWLLTSKLPLREKEGHIIGLIGIGRNITERKLAEEALRQKTALLEAQLNSSIDGILVVDGQGKKILQNQRMIELWKIPQQIADDIDDLKQVQHVMHLTKKPEEFVQKITYLYDHPEETSIDEVELTDGTVLDRYSAPVISKDGQNYGRIWAFRDITERKKAEEALRARDEQFRKLSSQVPGMIYQFMQKLDGTFCVPYSSDGIRYIFGCSPQDVHDDFSPIAKVVIPEDLNILVNSIKESARQLTPWSCEYRVQLPGQPIRWMFGQSMPEKLNDGTILWHGFNTDITEQKLAEQKIIKLNRTYEVLSNINQLIVRERDWQKLLNTTCKIAVEDGKFQLAWIGLLDESNGTINSSAHAGINNTYLDDLHKIKVNTPESESPSIKSIREGRYVVCNDIEHIQQHDIWRERAHTLGYKSSASFVLRLSSKIIGSINYFSNEPDYFDTNEVALLEELAMDVSFALESLEIENKRKLTQEALAREQYLMNMLMDNIPDHIYFKDTDSRFIRISRSQAEIFKLSDPSQAIGKSDFSFFNEEHARKAFRDEQEIISTGKHMMNLEEKETWPDGKETWMLTTKEPLIDKNGQIIGTFGISRDITDRKRNEEALLLQNTALQSAANAIVITDREGKIVSVNHAFSRFTGYSQEEVIGKKPSILKSGKQSDAFYKNLWETIVSGFVWKGELENRRKDGSTYTEEMTITPVYQAKGQISHFIAIKQDVTEQKKLQSQIFQSQKVQSIGTLAGGIAHDFNNILGIIMAFTSILEKSKGDMQKMLKCTDAITQAVNRGSALTRQILTFARQTGISVGAMSIPVLIKELLVMLKGTFPPIIEFQLSIEKDLPLINADSSQIHQVLLNLCVNARDAMPKGGTITINVKVVPLKELVQQFPLAEGERYIAMSVTDTGIGIDEKTKSRIFDPFFTTKELGKGTGLGLSVVYGVIQAHHGFISVESEPGKGSTFQIYLPAPPDAKNQKEISRSEMEQTQGGSETILFVEDEELLREAVQLSLESYGYNVILAVDGRDAIDIYKKRYIDIALVLSDMGLPKLNGVDVYAMMKEINPKVKIIFASGYIALESRSELFKEGVRGIIQKPYIMDEVLKIVRDVLNEK